MAYRSSSANGNYGIENVTLTAPSGIQDGDILLIVITVNGDPAVTWPSGFTEFSHNASGAQRAAYKVASSESGNYTCSWTGATFASAVMHAYSGRSTSMPPSVYDDTYVDVSPDTAVASVNVTGAGISASSGDDVAAFITMSYDNNGDYPTAMNVPATNYTAAAETRAQYNYYSAHSAYRNNVSGATGDLTFTFTSTGGADKIAAYTVLLVALPQAATAVKKLKLLAQPSDTMAPIYMEWTTGSDLP